MTGVLIKSRNLDTETDMYRGKTGKDTRGTPCEYGGREADDASKSQGMLGIGSKPPEVRRVRTALRKNRSC